jgi:hypothetical protein
MLWIRQVFSWLNSESTLQVKCGLAATAVVLAGASSLVFFLLPLRPWPDQGWVLQAAIRHSHGLGLTSQINAPESAIDQPKFVHLSYFPPVYPLIVSAFLRAGFSIDQTVTFINATGLAVGSLAWCCLAFRYLKTFIVQIVFVVLLVLAGSSFGSATIPTGGTADYVFWAALPFWLWLLIWTLGTHRSHGYLILIAASCLVGFLIGFRWAAAILVPIGCVILMVAPCRSFFDRVSQCFAYGIPATSTYLLIKLYNQNHSLTNSSYLDSVTPGWRWHLLQTSYPLAAFTTIPLGMESVFSRFARGSFSFHNPIIVPGLGLLVVCGLLAWTTYRWLHTTPTSERQELAPFQLVSSVLLLGTITFLGYMTVRYNWDHVVWSYLDEPRYFRPLSPVAAIFWLVIVERTIKQSDAAKMLLMLAYVGSLYLIQARCRAIDDLYIDAKERLELSQQVISVDNTARLSVVLDIDTSDYIIAPSKNTVSAYHAPAEQLSKISQPIDLYIVKRLDEATAYVKDSTAEKEIISAMIETSDARKVWNSSGGRFEIWHAKVVPK